LGSLPPETATEKEKRENIMKKLPEVDVSFKDLYSMLIGPIKSKLLLTGI
jgi:P2-related tail formation protein